MIQRDVNMCESLLEKEWITKEEGWLKQLKLMLEKGVEVVLEAIMQSDFLINEFSLFMFYILFLDSYNHLFHVIYVLFYMRQHMLRFESFDYFYSYSNCNIE